MDSLDYFSDYPKYDVVKQNNNDLWAGSQRGLYHRFSDKVRSISTNIDYWCIAYLIER